MEERMKQEQMIRMNNRKNAVISGVNDVISFDLNEIILDTEQGLLTIQGENLHVTSLTVEQGQVQLEGFIIALIYSPNKDMKKESGWLGRLFK